MKKTEEYLWRFMRDKQYQQRGKWESNVDPDGTC
jgi:hypothetical protein